MGPFKTLTTVTNRDYTPVWFCFYVTGLCGEVVTDRSPIMYCLDDTKPDGTFPCLMGFILADDARNMVHMTTEQR